MREIHPLAYAATGFSMTAIFLRLPFKQALLIFLGCAAIGVLATWIDSR